MLRVDINLCLALCAAATLCTAASVGDRRLQPMLNGYMGSLDYGGQPPSYQPIQSMLPANWPVDRRQGAPYPLSLVQPSGLLGLMQPLGVSPVFPQQQAATAPPKSSGFGFFGTLARMAVGAGKAVGGAMQRAGTGVAHSFEKGAHAVQSMFG